MKVSRLAEISRVFVEEGLALSPVEAHGEATGAEKARHVMPEDDREKAARLRRALERLGPTFVKFGQLLATRLDLFTNEFIGELSKLRAHVAPYPTEEARQILEAELGKPLDEVFSEFPAEPIASASMAQVYRARLREPQEWVAVKIARPHLRETLERDLEVIIDLSQLLDHILPVYHKSMVHRVAVEYAARARQESDLLAEAKAMEEFAVVTHVVSEFRVPKVYLAHCSGRVVVMEWFDGTLLDEVQGPEGLTALGVAPHDLALSLLRLQLVMSYEQGFVHGDTHPGNLILLESGKIGLIDFGLNGHVPRKLCDQMLELLFHQASGRTQDAVRAFEQIFTVSSPINRPKFEEELRAILEKDPKTQTRNPLTGQLVDGLRLGARYQLRAQSELFLVLRNLTIVEGIVLTYCPELDVVAEAREILQSIMLRRAMKGFGGIHLPQLIPLLLLNLSKRPQFIDSVLRLERSFSDASDLGEFLEREGVFERQAAARGRSLWLPLLVGAMGAVLGALLVRYL